MSFSVQIKGWDEALRHAKTIKAIFENFRRQLYELAKQALEKIKAAAPRKTGYMVSQMSISGSSGGAIVFTINLKARYTGFVEFGHRHWKSGLFVQGRNFVMPNYQWLLKEMGKLLRAAQQKNPAK